MIEKGGGRGLGRSVLIAQHDDDYDDLTVSELPVTLDKIRIEAKKKMILL